MAADIYGFLANFQGGGARPNRYEVMLTFPRTLGSTAIGQQISFTCKATSIPASNIGEAIAPYKGRQIKVPGDTTFDDWSVTVLVDNDFNSKSVFEEWLNLMNVGKLTQPPVVLCHQQLSMVMVLSNNLTVKIK